VQKKEIECKFLNNENDSQTKVEHCPNKLVTPEEKTFEKFSFVSAL
jgi:hypothetical protein